MMDKTQQLDNSVIAELQNKDHSEQLKHLDNLSCTHGDIIELLAQYLALSEQDDDSQFDAWYDALCQDQLRVLKAFEIFRAHYEQAH